MVGSLPCPQILEQGGGGWQWQILNLSWYGYNCGFKKFLVQDPSNWGPFLKLQKMKPCVKDKSFSVCLCLTLPPLDKIRVIYIDAFQN